MIFAIFMQQYGRACIAHKTMPIMRKRLTLFLGLAILMTFLAVHIILPRIKTRYHYQAAQRLLLHFDLELAQQHLNQCLEIEPDDPASLILAARTARRNGQPDIGANHLERLDQLEGVTPAGALEHTLQQTGEGNLSEESALRALIKQSDEEAPIILEAMTQGFLNTLRLDQALECVQDLLSRQPNNPLALIWRGRIHEIRNQDDEALGDYQRSVELQPKSDKARRYLADALDRAGQLREAVGHYQILHDNQPGNLEVTLHLAHCQFDLSNHDECRQLLDKWIAEHPGCVKALVERGRLALHEDDDSGAEKWLKLATTQAPKDRDALFVLHACLDRQGKGKEADQCLALLKQVEIRTTHTAALMRRVLESPNDPALRFQLGVTLNENGDEEQGLRWMLTALQVDPNYEPARAFMKHSKASKGTSGPSPFMR
jgi:tetratricopeptide (TPR) repeat protein